MSIIHTFDPDPIAMLNPHGKKLEGMRKLDAIIINFSWSGIFWMRWQPM